MGRLSNAVIGPGVAANLPSTQGYEQPGVAHGHTTTTVACCSDGSTLPSTDSRLCHGGGRGKGSAAAGQGYPISTRGAPPFVAFSTLGAC